MGLGKTLMSICMVAADHHYRLKENKSELPSLVICPPTLTGHWYFERVSLFEFLFNHNKILLNFFSFSLYKIDYK